MGVSTFVKFTAWGMAILYASYFFFLQANFIAPIGAGLAIYSAEKSSKLFATIKKNETTGYLYGAVLGLIGLLILHLIIKYKFSN